MGNISKSINGIGVGVLMVCTHDNANEVKGPYHDIRWCSIRAFVFLPGCRRWLTLVLFQVIRNVWGTYAIYSTDCQDCIF